MVGNALKSASFVKENAMAMRGSFYANVINNSRPLHTTTY